VLLKAEVAELLFPSVIKDLAFQKDIDVDLHKVISLQVIFFFSLQIFILLSSWILSFYRFSISALLLNV
jgi:hypothetical protein